jgi:hypothetical protein
MTLALLLFLTEPFERVVATVDHQVITLLEVRKAARIEMVRGGAVTATVTEPAPDLLELMRAHLIQEALLLDEAQKSALQPVPEHDVDQAFAIFAARFPTPQALQQFLTVSSLSIDEIRDSLRRSLRVDRVLEARVHSRIQISTADVAKYRAAHPDAFSWTVAEVTRQATQEQLALRTRGYLQELCERAEVRMLGPIDPKGQAPQPCALPRAGL